MRIAGGGGQSRAAAKLASIVRTKNARRQAPAGRNDLVSGGLCCLLACC